MVKGEDMAKKKKKNEEKKQEKAELLKVKKTEKGFDADKISEEAAVEGDTAVKHKLRDESEYKDLMNRLKRIEGQVRGVEGMLEEGAYCTDILIQVSAINSALNSFNKVLLNNHLKSCVCDEIRKGNDEIVDELSATIQKLMK